MRLSQAPRTIGGLAASALLVIGTALYAHANPEAAPVAQTPAATGTITGRVIWTGATVPVPKIEVAKGDPKVKEAVCKADQIVSKDITVDPKTKGIAEALVYVLKPVGDFSAAEKALLAKTPEVVIDQVGCEFVPYVSIVSTGQKLTFKSSDPVGHNVHLTTSNNGSMNQMLAPNGKMNYALKATEKRPSSLVCDIHPWMKSYVLILDHPLAAVTKADGTFEIHGVPAGAQQLIVWQTNAGFVNAGLGKGMTVTVPADGTVALPDFTISALKK